MQDSQYLEQHWQYFIYIQTATPLPHLLIGFLLNRRRGEHGRSFGTVVINGEINFGQFQELLAQFSQSSNSRPVPRPVPSCACKWTCTMNGSRTLSKKNIVFCSASWSCCTFVVVVIMGFLKNRATRGMNVRRRRLSELPENSTRWYWTARWWWGSELSSGGASTRQFSSNNNNNDKVAELSVWVALKTGGKNLFDSYHHQQWSRKRGAAATITGLKLLVIVYAFYSPNKHNKGSPGVWWLVRAEPRINQIRRNGQTVIQQQSSFIMRKCQGSPNVAYCKRW